MICTVVRVGPHRVRGMSHRHGQRARFPSPDAAIRGISHAGGADGVFDSHVAARYGARVSRCRRPGGPRRGPTLRIPSASMPRTMRRMPFPVGRAKVGAVHGARQDHRVWGYHRADPGVEPGIRLSPVLPPGRRSRREGCDYGTVAAWRWAVDCGDERIWVGNRRPRYPSGDPRRRHLHICGIIARRVDVVDEMVSGARPSS